MSKSADKSQESREVEWSGSESALQLLATCQRQRCVAIVGARAADHVGLEWSRNLAKVAAEHQVPVISGGARGVDEQAHLTARTYAGESLAILGCGLQHLTSRHRDLRTQGVELVSPFAPHHRAQRWTFPKRNLLIASIASEVIVVQATLRSGSLSTARAALRYGKPVWVLTHLPQNILHQGCLALLRDGAQALTNDHVWLTSVSQAFSEVTSPPLSSPPLSHQPSQGNSPPSEATHPSPLWRATGAEARSLDQLASRAELPYTQALTEATLLELEGWLIPTFGGQYTRGYGPPSS